MRKVLALVAHDAKKDDLMQLIKAHKEELAEIDLVATRDTGQLIQERTGLPITLLQSGPLGGDQQIGALIASDEVDAVIFLRDALTADSREPDVSALLRVCDVHNVALVTNLAAAEAVLRLIAEHPDALGRHQLAARFIEEVIAKHD
jgi:methylglyoxal synthase